MANELIFSGVVDGCNDIIALRMATDFKSKAFDNILAATGSFSLASGFFLTWDRIEGSESQYSFTVKAPGKLLIYLEKGTKPHKMGATPGKSIPMRIGGRIVFRKVTMSDIAKGKWEHPGTEPKKMFRSAWEEVLTDYEVKEIESRDNKLLRI